MTKRRWTVGVDFGGTTIKVGLVNARDHVVAMRQLVSRAIGHPAAFLAHLSGAIEELGRQVGVRPAQLRGVGVGAPGTVDVTRGIVHAMVNVPGWREVPLRALLERRLGCRCAVDNDANLCTLGEWRFGAGRGARHLVGVTLGTGVGGGLILDGRVYRGAVGAGGEIGHLIVEPDGSRCACGARGCLEAYVGTAAIVRVARQAIRRRAGPLQQLARQAHGRITPALVSQAAQRGDRAAKQIWADLGRTLGVALAGLVNVLNPDRIIIGGGVAKAWRFFAPTMRATLAREAMPTARRAMSVVPGRLGDHAGILGAAVLVWSETR